MPSRENPYPSSHPIGPAPITSIDCGSSVRLKILSEVNILFLLMLERPSISGIDGLAPVAITALLNSIFYSFTKIVFLSMNLA